MSKELDTLIRWHKEGQKVLLAIVLKTWGSAPRQSGSMMVIRSDMAFEGSVSGGCVEGDVIAEAANLLHFGGAKKLNYGISNDDAWSVGLSCGGRIKVLLIAVSDDHIAHIHKLQSNISIGINACLEVDLRTGAFSIPNLVSDDVLQSKTAVLTEGSIFIPFYPADQLVIVGAVHIAQALAPMAVDIGYNVTVVDPRGAFVREERFPSIQLIEDWPDAYLGVNFPTSATAIVLLTHSPDIDDAALQVALKSPAFYIGALGSRKTHAERLKRLRENGITEETLKRIKAPIGLDIKAQTPKEIAVSIMAEIIAVKRST